MSTDEGLTWLYAATGPLLACAYLPQLVVLWRDDSGARATSLLTWAVWSLCLLVTVLYAWRLNPDPVFLFTSTCSFLGCTSVFLLACLRRARRSR